MQTIEVSAPSVLRPSPIGRCQVVNGVTFSGRPTVVTPLVYRRKQLLLVRNTKGKNWIFVQGGYMPGDQTIGRTARREIWEEVGLADTHLFGYEVELGQCVNEVTKKHLFVLAVPVFQAGKIVLGDGKNDMYQWVNSYDHFRTLTELTEKEHPIKHKLMLDALGVMRGKKVLDWGDVPPMLH